MNTYERKEVITKYLQDFQRTDDLTTEKQQPQEINPTQRDTVIHHVNPEKDSLPYQNIVKTGENDYKDQKYEQNDDTNRDYKRSNFGKTEYSKDHSDTKDYDHSKIGKTEYSKDHSDTKDYDHSKIEKTEYSDTKDHSNFGNEQNVDNREYKRSNFGKTEYSKDHSDNKDYDHSKIEKTEYSDTKDYDRSNFGKTEYSDTKHHTKIGHKDHSKPEEHTDISEKEHKKLEKNKKKKVKSDHVVDTTNTNTNTNDEKPTIKEKAKEKLHNLGEKVGLVKPETHTTTIKEELSPDGTKRIIKEEKNSPEHVGFGKPETEVIRTEEIVDANGNRTILTKEGRENVGLLTQPESHKTKVKVERGVDGKEKIVTERKDNPEHVGLFLPETAKIKTKEYVEPDGTRLVKTKEGTEHMGLATHPETHKTYAKIERETDGTRMIEKETRVNQEQMGLGKPTVDVDKSKAYVDAYGNKSVVEEHASDRGYGKGSNTGVGQTTGDTQKYPA